MRNNNKIENLIDLYSNKLMELLIQSFTPGERSYGFEYEFISSQPLCKEDMQRIYDLLPELGFSQAEAKFTSESGMYITIEPGGQIEYCSPPILKNDNGLFNQLMGIIKKTNNTIKENLGIEYIGAGYIPDRGKVPMILEAQRYQNLHNRMAVTGTRGREMMKGTASIHLHARIMDKDDMIPLFARFVELSKKDEFKMSSDRRDIWNNTDPVRCGQPIEDVLQVKDPEDLIHRIVQFTMAADDIGENVPFPDKADTSFEAFLYHMTTIFTDIRLNMKGPTWELRTLDSQPIPVFEKKWATFIDSIEST